MQNFIKYLLPVFVEVGKKVVRSLTNKRQLVKFPMIFFSRTYDRKQHRDVVVVITQTKKAFEIALEMTFTILRNAFCQPINAVVGRLRKMERAARWQLGLDARKIWWMIGKVTDTLRYNRCFLMFWLGSFQSSVDVIVLSHVWPQNCTAMMKKSLKYIPFFNIASLLVWILSYCIEHTVCTYFTYCFFMNCIICDCIAANMLLNAAAKFFMVLMKCGLVGTSSIDIPLQCRLGQCLWIDTIVSVQDSH